MLNKLANSGKVINAFNRFFVGPLSPLYIYIYNETRVLSLIPRGNTLWRVVWMQINGLIAIHEGG